ncbi:hypothetical protein Cyrtocomes_00472 [Candidatus Cyrtobacter comes]|uniref:Uncharacterized protein n=1 Tax=Candidatus Cyrtobacter comes TaxID=675776 RepID=A0ABU5L7K3_9RICK|nr:hypothetical protein [Candidatus Cyrtobacter comes]MDZ5762104.1 hypothetical protein [Candidatus Cyrtobacter comes]
MSLELTSDNISKIRSEYKWKLKWEIEYNRGGTKSYSWAEFVSARYNITKKNFKKISDVVIALDTENSRSLNELLDRISSNFRQLDIEKDLPDNLKRDLYALIEKCADLDFLKDESVLKTLEDRNSLIRELEPYIMVCINQIIIDELTIKVARDVADHWIGEKYSEVSIDTDVIERSVRNELSFPNINFNIVATLKYALLDHDKANLCKTLNTFQGFFYQLINRVYIGLHSLDVSVYIVSCIKTISSNLPLFEKRSKIRKDSIKLFSNIIKSNIIKSELVTRFIAEILKSASLSKEFITSFQEYISLFLSGVLSNIEKLITETHYIIFLNIIRDISILKISLSFVDKSRADIIRLMRHLSENISPFKTFLEKVNVSKEEFIQICDCVLSILIKATRLHIMSLLEKSIPFDRQFESIIKISRQLTTANIDLIRTFLKTLDIFSNVSIAYLIILEEKNIKDLASFIINIFFRNLRDTETHVQAKNFIRDVIFSMIDILKICLSNITISIFFNSFKGFLYLFRSPEQLFKLKFLETAIIANITDIAVLLFIKRDDNILKIIDSFNKLCLELKKNKELFIDFLSGSSDVYLKNSFPIIIDVLIKIIKDHFLLEKTEISSVLKKDKMLIELLSKIDLSNIIKQHRQNIKELFLSVANSYQDLTSIDNFQNFLHEVVPIVLDIIEILTDEGLLRVIGELCYNIQDNVDNNKNYLALFLKKIRENGRFNSLYIEKIIPLLNKYEFFIIKLINHAIGDESDIFINAKNFLNLVKSPTTIAKLFEVYGVYRDNKSIFRLFYTIFRSGQEMRSILFKFIKDKIIIACNIDLIPGFIKRFFFQDKMISYLDKILHKIDYYTDINKENSLVKNFINEKNYSKLYIANLSLLKAKISNFNFEFAIFRDIQFLGCEISNTNFSNLEIRENVGFANSKIDVFSLKTLILAINKMHVPHVDISGVTLLFPIHEKQKKDLNLLYKDQIGKEIILNTIKKHLALYLAPQGNKKAILLNIDNVLSNVQPSDFLNTLSKFSQKELDRLLFLLSKDDFKVQAVADFIYKEPNSLGEVRDNIKSILGFIDKSETSNEKILEALLNDKAQNALLKIFISYTYEEDKKQIIERNFIDLLSNKEGLELFASFLNVMIQHSEINIDRVLPILSLTDHKRMRFEMNKIIMMNYRDKGRLI